MNFTCIFNDTVGLFFGGKISPRVMGNSAQLVFDCDQGQRKVFISMAAVTICSDFRAQENEVCHYFQFPPPICHKVMVLDAIILVF